MWRWQVRRVQRADEYFYSTSLFPGAAANPLRVSGSSRGPRDLHCDQAVIFASPAACLPAAAGADQAVTFTSPAACLPAAAGADQAVTFTSPAACRPAAAGADQAVTSTFPAACFAATAVAAGPRAISGRRDPSLLSLLPTLPIPTPACCCCTRDRADGKEAAAGGQSHGGKCPGGD